MDFKEIQGLVLKGESETVEFKRSTGQRTEAAKTVCAFLNGLGGFVIFGVSEKGEMLGQQVVAKTLLVGAARPESRPELRPESLEEKILVLLKEAPLSKMELVRKLGHKAISSGLKKVLQGLFVRGIIGYTIPEKSKSRLQKYKIRADLLNGERPESGPELKPELKPESLAGEILVLLKESPLSKIELVRKLGHKAVSGGFKKVLRDLFAREIIVHTMPEKPKSRLQKYKIRGDSIWNA